MREPDAAFADPRLAALYDYFDHERSDLDLYVALVTELGADKVVDLGCGTGSLAVLLAAIGVQVIGVDPALASLAVAQQKPGSEAVEWVPGDATALVDRGVDADMVVMAGNVAQVFVAEEDWRLTLDAVHSTLHPGGWLVFETRRPQARAWEEWDVEPTTTALPDGRTVVVSRSVTSAEEPLVTFRSVTANDGESISSCSTLRFRDRDEIEGDLLRHRFAVQKVRDAPDRPGEELVFIARALPRPLRMP